MEFNKIVNLLEGKFGKEVVLGVDEHATPKVIEVPVQYIVHVCQELYENEQTYFDFLSCLTGLDNGPEAGTMEVIYHLYSIPFDVQLALKVKVLRNTSDQQLPKVPSVSQIWRTALWHEREAYDLVGISFEGHPDLRRILMPADWQGHPLRKDYQNPEYYQGIKVQYE
jgi:NADH-quinone oxidoreductase subunit C